MKKVALLVIVAMVLGTFGYVAFIGDDASAAVRIQKHDRDRVCDNCGFIDEDGDGVCDNCGECILKGNDDDGDGIPNGKDPDYVPPQDGSGKKR